MKDGAGVLLAATVWAYWIGVGLMIVRVHRKTRTLGGLIPEQSLERVMWLAWVPLVAAWLALPYLALVRIHGPLALPAFALLAAGYAALRWIAAAAAFAALLLTSLCWARMGTGWRMGVSKSGGERLITDGMFRYVRHPIYALSMLLMACSMVVVPTAPMLVVGAAHFVLLQIKARNEERHLLAEHGDAYRDYLARTGRFFPWMRTAHD
ncbi:MAG TPA: isoprenylcysteine carboxylmethyltransferase family protein [Casimicrobiaceae bacterium]|nr:isoprenylcysteine carboxylmethyltransferase family protein [Casimicrobiaceae bacterium]